MDLSISVVIPSFNSAQVLEQCIRSIKIKLSQQGKLLFAMLGALETTSTYVLFVESEMQLTENVLMECVAEMKEGVAGVVVPEIDIGTSY